MRRARAGVDLVNHYEGSHRGMNNTSWGSGRAARPARGGAMAAGKPGKLRRSAMACAFALALPLAVGTLLPAPVFAAQAPAQRQAYAITAGDLHQALNELSAQGGVQVVYAPELVAGKTTRGLSGSFTPVEALRRLLGGTGLAWKAVDGSTFVLKRAAQEPQPASPQGVHKADADKSARTLDTVTVSGSLINNAQIQTATPTVTITADEIRSQGFDDVEDVLQNSVFSVGSVQGESHSGSFTQGAQTFRMFGLAPGFTLLLIDGKPVTNFGELYNGNSSFNNVSNIPVSMIDHIDIMPGGGSSIYGSSAIAGVVNIVTKSHLNGAEVDVRTGNYKEGGGANQRITFGFGHDFGKLNVLGSLEFDNRSPIWNFQRGMTRGVDSDPDGAYTPSPVAELETHGTSSHLHSGVQGYLSPGDGCAAMGGLFGGTTVETGNITSPKRTGTYCGSNDVNGYRTLQSQKRNYDGLLKLRYDVNDNLRLYSDVMMDYETKRYASGSPDWSAEDFPQGYIEDASTHEVIDPTRYFAPEEMPGGYSGDLRMYTQNDLLAQMDIGANGQFGQSDWTWDAYYMHSSDRTRYSKPLYVTSEVDGFFSNYFLGPVVGVDPKTGMDMFHPDYQAFYTPLTPEQYASFTQRIGGIAKTWVNNTRVTLSNSSLFALPGGDAGFAVLLEGGNEAWYEPANVLYATGQVFGHTATSGGGRRRHQASAFELNLPLLRQLTLDLSGRYDHYSTDVGPDNHKFTYKAGIEYRPFDTLLIRGNYATAFQAPQMPAMFLGPSQSYSDVIDYYQCQTQHGVDCDDYETQVKVTHEGNTRLKPTTAQSWSLGTVWAPLPELSFNLDYLHINIQNEVVLQDKDTIMKDEAQCRLGGMDPDSTRCQLLTGGADPQVRRDVFGNVSGVTAYYANLANEVTESITAGAKYHFSISHLGRFGLSLQYNDMLKHQYREYPGTPMLDELADPYYSVGFKSVFSGSLTWEPNSHWSTTVYGHRYGKAPNYIAYEDGADHAGAGYLHPWITFNWGLAYKPTSKLELSLQVHNVANKMPPYDATYASYPYYNDELYNVLGREYMLGARLKL